MTKYFLLVDLIVPQEDATKFESCVAEFNDAGGFSRLEPTFALDLALALKTPAPFPYVAYGRFKDNEISTQTSSAPDVYRDARLRAREGVYRYVHLWTIPSLKALDLASLMIRAADDPLYMSIDECVVREIQNFVRATELRAAPLSLADGRHFARVVRQCRSKDLGTYLFKSGVLLPILAKAHWHQIAQLQNVTGSLNVVTEIWQTEGPNDLQNMKTALAGFPDSEERGLIKDVLHLPVGEARETFIVPSYFKIEAGR